MRLSLTGWMTPAPFWGNLRWRCREPDVGLRVEHLDLVAVDLVIGVEGAEAVGPTTEHKHFCADHSGRVEVPPASWWPLRSRSRAHRHIWSKASEHTTLLHWVLSHMHNNMNPTWIDPLKRREVWKFWLTTENTVYIWNICCARSHELVHCTQTWMAYPKGGVHIILRESFFVFGSQPQSRITLCGFVSSQSDLRELMLLPCQLQPQPLFYKFLALFMLPVTLCASPKKQFGRKC